MSLKHTGPKIDIYLSKGFLGGNAKPVFCNLFHILKIQQINMELKSTTYKQEEIASLTFVLSCSLAVCGGKWQKYSWQQSASENSIYNKIQNLGTKTTSTVRKLTIQPFTSPPTILPNHANQATIHQNPKLGVSTHSITRASITWHFHVKKFTHNIYTKLAWGSWWGSHPWGQIPSTAGFWGRDSLTLPPPLQVPGPQMLDQETERVEVWWGPFSLTTWNIYQIPKIIAR